MNIHLPTWGKKKPPTLCSEAALGTLLPTVPTVMNPYYNQ
jgi:hypothetical protein